VQKHPGHLNCYLEDVVLVSTTKTVEREEMRQHKYTTKTEGERKSSHFIMGE